ncbi:MAG: hypothetical protein FJZ47_15550 [Candidatus Tectomicrobia bacterium]|uniref:Uncharacterized protein n=1 Tax=Tectimicrobiota bacterium TaxID=2528274 RepID=A0A937W1L3_UNCTE|nr:hypothetical protein [Candidatus Tectomicrobia bacterium]
MLRLLPKNQPDPSSLSCQLQKARQRFLQRCVHELRSGMYPLRVVQVKAQMRKFLSRMQQT